MMKMKRKLVTIDTCIINVLYSGQEVNDETSWKPRTIRESQEACHGLARTRVSTIASAPTNDTIGYGNTMYEDVRNIAILCLCALLTGGLSCGQKDRLSQASIITIYFVDWDLLTYTRMSCDDLRSAQTSIVISEPRQIQEFVAAYENATFDEQADFDGLDVRICCILADGAGNVIAEVSFSPTSMMQVDDKIYNTDAPLFQLVLSHLPSDYKV